MQFIKESLIRVAPERVFAFHEQDNALEQLMPPWETVRVIQRARISDIGSRAIIDTRVLGPFKVRWVAEHTRYEPPQLFEDVQVEGPFRSWRHRHIISEHTEGAILRDEIEYEPPLAFIGKAVAPLLIERRLKRLFEYRHQVTRKWCERSSSKVQSPMSKV
ncbi:MAG: SRPBCC family protein [Pyrinomonadaceae bacterium]